MPKDLKLLITSFDWRNLFETNINEIFEKLERDGFAPTRNIIFSINWSKKRYYKKVNNNLETVHMRAYMGTLRFWYDFASIFMVPLVLKKYHFIPDVVVVRDFQSVLFGCVVKYIWGSKIALILTNIPTQVIRTRPFWWILFLYQIVSEFFLKHFIDYAIAISGTTKEYFKKLGISEDKIKVFAPNVIKRDEKFIEAAHVGMVRERFSIPKDKKIILSVGRLESEKNFQKLIESFYVLKDESLVLVIVGQGKLRQELEVLVTRLHLKDRVFFAGSVERDEIWNFYRDADIFILLSKSEGLGLVFWEAMYMRVPVIGPCIEGIAESIGEDALRGFFWNEKDTTLVLKEKIQTCCKRTKEVGEMVGRAKIYVEEKIRSQESINQLLS